MPEKYQDQLSNTNINVPSFLDNNCRFENILKQRIRELTIPFNYQYKLSHNRVSLVNITKIWKNNSCYGTIVDDLRNVDSLGHLLYD